MDPLEYRNWVRAMDNAARIAAQKGPSCQYCGQEIGQGVHFFARRGFCGERCVHDWAALHGSNGRSVIEEWRRLDKEASQSDNRLIVIFGAFFGLIAMYCVLSSAISRCSTPSIPSFVSKPDRSSRPQPKAVESSREIVTGGSSPFVKTSPERQEFRAARPDVARESADPRIKGLHYFVLTSVREAYAWEMEVVDFCRTNGLDAHLVADDNTSRVSLIVLPGFDGATQRSSPEVEALEAKIRSVGKKWKQSGGGNDFDSVYPAVFR